MPNKFQNTIYPRSKQETSNQSVHGSAILYNEQSELKLKKSNVMLLGPSGSGKTLLVKTIAKCLDVPYIICNCAKFMPLGSIQQVYNIITELFQMANYVKERAQMGIIFLDEVDKIGLIPIKHLPPNVQMPGVTVQQTLTAMMEGTYITTSSKEICVDTTNILFIASGTFHNLEKIIIERISTDMPIIYSMSNVPDSCKKNIIEDTLFKQIEAKDLICFGMLPQFVHCFDVLVPLHNLNKEMLIRILTEPENAVVRQYQKLFAMNEVTLEFAEDALNAIAALALERKAGARGLHAIIESVLLEPMFKIPGSDVISIKITEECVKGRKKPTYYIG